MVLMVGLVLHLVVEVPAHLVCCFLLGLFLFFLFFCLPCFLLCRCVLCFVFESLALVCFVFSSAQRASCVCLSCLCANEMLLPSRLFFLFFFFSSEIAKTSQKKMSAIGWTNNKVRDALASGFVLRCPSFWVLFFHTKPRLVLRSIIAILFFFFFLSFLDHSPSC